MAISSRKAIKKAVIFSQILETFISSEVHTWRGAGNKKSSRHRTKGTEVVKVVTFMKAFCNLIVKSREKVTKSKRSHGSEVFFTD